MSRPLRTVLLMGLIAVVAVVVLGVIAKRFAALAETGFAVNEAITPKNSTAELLPDLNSQVMDTTIPVAVPRSDPDRATQVTGQIALETVDDFIFVRSSYLATLEERPSVYYQIKLEIDNKLGEPDSNPIYLDHKAELVLMRRTKMSERRMTPDTYLHVRESFRNYMSGEGVVDQTLQPAFEKRKPQLRSLWLGRYEAVDF